MDARFIYPLKHATHLNDARCLGISYIEIWILEYAYQSLNGNSWSKTGDTYCFSLTLFVSCSLAWGAGLVALTMGRPNKYYRNSVTVKTLLCWKPIDLQKCMPSTMKQSCSKCLQQSTELDDGPSQLLHSLHPFCT